MVFWKESCFSGAGPKRSALPPSLPPSIPLSFPPPTCLFISCHFIANVPRVHLKRAADLISKVSQSEINMWQEAARNDEKHVRCDTVNYGRCQHGGMSSSPEGLRRHFGMHREAPQAQTSLWNAGLSSCVLFRVDFLIARCWRFNGGAAQMLNLRQGCAAFVIFYQHCSSTRGERRRQSSSLLSGGEHKATPLTSCQFVTGPHSANKQPSERTFQSIGSQP